MFVPAELPEQIPLFPLPGAIVLPRARLPLQIFEPRYLAMLDDVLKSPKRLIGMVQPLPDQSGRLHDVGCVGRLTSFVETDDGRYMVTLTGISRFRISGVIEGFSPYLKANADWSGFERDLVRAPSEEKFERSDFLVLLRRYFEAQELSTDWDSLKDAEDELLVNSLSMLCPFALEDKQALLEAHTLSERRQTLETLMDFALRSGSGDEVMQ
ncbi:LON peptidase substrate-binding domain-containing protein [Cochlodiniinecator piscidefendens]|uniref:LON peptidase substrate-binding domain-containing protein n=1 Tax=Cochlodiniinecator piscidefendens TaxID=2715756 RepID=UPI0014079D41|nr:LON peptidase substrate-binding domain-containing protein [Cochlodiniinecator piscidefendens]